MKYQTITVTFDENHSTLNPFEATGKHSKIIEWIVTSH